MQRALEGLEGVASVGMRYEDKEFDIVYDGRVTVAKVIEVVAAAGFKSSLVQQEPDDRAE